MCHRLAARFLPVADTGKLFYLAMLSPTLLSACHLSPG